MPDHSRRPPLQGVKIVDLTSARAGPAATRQLADMGAEVVHVAPVEGSPALPSSDTGNLMRGKRSIGLNLKTSEGMAVLRRLICRSDVLVENWRPQVKHRLGLDPSSVLAWHPKLVYASISGYGQDGPDAESPSLDQIAQGVSGIMSVTGPAGAPHRTGLAVTDLVAGTFLAQGVLAALLERERSGEGQWVHTSLLEAGISLLDFQAVRWLNERQEPVGAGNSHPTLPAMATFTTADGLMNLAVISRFPEFFDRIGLPELVDDPRFATATARLEHRRQLNDVLAERLRQRTTADWMKLLQPDFPCGPVLRVSEALANPQVKHLAVSETAESEHGDVQVLRHPVNFSTGFSRGSRLIPSEQGDTRAVLAEVGCSEHELRALADRGVIRPSPVDTNEKGQ